MCVPVPPRAGLDVEFWQCSGPLPGSHRGCLKVSIVLTIFQA
jgi:hypothetical protein